MKTHITFELESDTSVSIKQDGKQVGRIWSEHKDGTLPFPHDETERTKTTVQLCGFDRQSEVWACGPFEGKRDSCFTFLNPDKDDATLKRYKEYIIWYSESGNDMSKLKNYVDWKLHHF